ncbi:hypothetical protein CEXT_280191, partial [Caerostris extrusa]
MIPKYTIVSIGKGCKSQRYGGNASLGKESQVSQAVLLSLSVQIHATLA